MPKRTDIHKILIIGSGPIVIGQACEFDYSGTQACKALKEEGFEVVLVNSNPATIMTDPSVADHTYIEPITPEIVAKIIERERPDAILPTMGGQTGLNTAMELAENGVLARFNVQLIGANEEAIKRAEDRHEFKNAMLRIGMDLPKSAFAYNMDEAWEIARSIGFPLIIRPSFTLGGTGGGIVYSEADFNRAAQYGLHASRINEILLEESVIGWKEYELEVMRDRKDNVVIVCSIENLDPMGVHTGDSVTVAPAQTLTDRRVPDDARRIHCHHPGDRRGDRRVEHPVRRASGDRPHGGDRDEPARQPQFGPGQQGHRLPHREVRGEARGGVHARRDRNDITRETPPRSSRPSTTAWSRFRALPLKNSPRPIPRSAYR